jgi:hypothetical protein
LIGAIAEGDEVKFRGDIRTKKASGVRPMGDSDIATGFVTLVHEGSGLKQKVKLGFSWTVLFFGFFFGIPLFMRKLVMPGLVMCALMFINYLLTFQARYVEFMGETYFFLFGAQVSLDEMQMWFGAYFLVEFVVSLYFAAKANKWYVRQLLEQGYQLPADSKPAVKKMLQDYAEISEAPSARGAEVTPQTAPIAPKAEAGSLSIKDRLQHLKALLDDGLISDEEYQTKRQSIVDAI